MRQILGLAAVLAVGSAATAADAKFPLTGENTTVGFVGTKPGGKHEGGFKKVTGSATVTDADPTKVVLEVVIDTDSLWSDDAKLTGHLKAPDFFDVKTNPTAKFASTKVEKSATGLVVTGDLTLNGQTKSVTFPAKIGTTGGLTVDAEFMIDRTEFGMTYGKGKIDDKVAVTVKVAAK
ncbi:MAG: YceI family protein [Fimbriiglobus sp.]